VSAFDPRGAVGLRSCATGVARSLDVRRRTRRSEITVEDTGPDVTIGRAAADHEGARPYRRPADTFLRPHPAQVRVCERKSMRISLKV
jgi:hypothetical protein